MDRWQELQDEVAAYLDHRRSLDEVGSWLAAAAPEIARLRLTNHRAWNLAGRVWAVLWEWQAEHISDDEAQAELRRALALASHEDRDDLTRHADLQLFSLYGWTSQSTARPIVREAADYTEIRSLSSGSVGPLPRMEFAFVAAH
jgi:hypothetical protein